MSIRAILFTAIIGLGTLLACFAGYTALQALDGRSLAKRIIAVYESENLLIDASDALVAENANVQLAYSQTNPIDEKHKSALQESRKLSADSFDRGIANVQAQRDFEGKSEHVANAKAAYAKLIEARNSIDEVLAKPKSERNPQAAGSFETTITETIQAAQTLKGEVEGHSFDNDPVDCLLEMKNFAWGITESIGKQQTLLAESIARGEPISEENRITLLNLSGKIGSQWDQITEFIGADYISTKLKDGYNSAYKEYTETYSPLFNQIVKAGQAERPEYSVTGDQWFEKASSVIKNIAVFSDLVGESTEFFAHENETAATSSLIIFSILMLCVVACACFALYVVNNRVIRSIIALKDNINKIREGDTSTSINVSRHDEIGAITAALNDLRETVAQAFQQQQMIQDIPISVVVSDPSNNFAVTYANKANGNNMRTIEKNAGNAIPEAARKSIDLFLKNPGQRDQLRNPQNLPVSNRIQIGSDWVDAQCSAICDKTGKYTALMTTWNIVTERVKMADNFESSVKGVVDLVSSASGQLKTSAATMAQNADKTNHSSNIVASASEEASANVQTVASSAEELSNSIQEIARQVAQSTMICNKAVGQAKSTNATIQSLADAAHKIGEVVNLITEIAGKTNLLALNATIEAARAGDAGKGFAVVASEVKDLANQTAKATDEIAGQISAIQNSTSDAVKAIETIGNVIGDLNEIATSIASAVEEQGAATKEIAMNVQQTATGTQEVSSNIVNVSRAASETGNAANEVLVSAEELSRQSDVLRNEVDRFLREIRVA